MIQVNWRLFQIKQYKTKDSHSIADILPITNPTSVAGFIGYIASLIKLYLQLYKCLQLISKEKNKTAVKRQLCSVVIKL